MPHLQTSEGHSYHYELVGSGPPLILLHGSIQSAKEWHRAGWVDLLKSRRSLILIDLLGHGESDSPLDRSAYKVEAQAQAVIDIADLLGHDVFEILGFSLGGRISYELAARHSERLGAILIIAQHARAPRSEPRLLDLIDAYRNGRLPAMERGLGIRPIRPARTVNDPEIMALTIEALTEWQGAESRLDSISIPTLVIAGERDFSYEAASITATAIPSAEFIMLPGMEHSETFYKPEAAFPHIAAFLDRTDDAIRS